MATVSAPSDQTAEMLQKLTLDSQGKPLEIPEPTKKTAVYHTELVDSNRHIPPFDRSVTPVLPNIVDPTLCYVQNGYQPYYFGGFGTINDWNEYPSYASHDGVDMASGVYGENGPLAFAGYGYTPYPYSPATSPVPTVGADGSFYGAQQYQYPSYFPLNPGSESFTPMTASLQGGHSTIKVTDAKPLSETAKISSNGISKTGVAVNSGSTRVKAGSQNSLHPSSNSYESGATGAGFPFSYHDPRLGHEGFPSPMPLHGVSKFSDGCRQVSGTEFDSSFSKANNIPSSRSLNYASNSQYMGLHQHVGAQSYYNRVYTNKSYGQNGNGSRSGVGYGSTGYDSRTNGRGWLASDRIRNRGRGNNYFHESNTYGLNELNRGPRAKSTMNPKDVSDSTLVVKGQNGTSNVVEAKGTDETCVAPDIAQYNKGDFPEDYADAKFFVIKSYSEDDVHKSIKYNVWASTPNGNKKLDVAYQECQQKSGGCPVFLFFSVNTSGQFIGLAEMVGPVDFTKNVEYWQQDKWTGSFALKWHIVKDVPNSLLKHIILENNENKPVTNSRDTQEVKLEQGLKMIKIFKEHSSKSCILDDFAFYEARQKAIQDKKAKVQQYQNQAVEGNSVDGKQGSWNTDSKLPENGSVARNGDVYSIVKQDGVSADGVASGC